MHSILQSLKFVLLYLAIFTFLRIFNPSNFQYLQHIYSFVVTFLIAILFYRLRELSSPQFLYILVFLLATFNLTSTLSMNIDRSKSVQVLLIAQQSENSGRSTKNILISSGINDPSTIESYVRRISEQSQVGMIKGGAINPRLTFLGKTFLLLANQLAQLWNLDGFRSLET